MNILSAKLPPDDVEARLMRFEGIRRQRNAEIFLIGGHAPTSPLVGGIYNTVGLNDPEEVGDTCPQEFLDRVDLEELKDDYEILGTFKIGPRLRCIDWLEVMVGAQRHLMGLDARWVMWLDVLEEMREHEEVAYKRIEGKRDTQMGMNAGEPAFILDGREGDCRVMKSAGLIIDPTQTYDRLKELGRRLQPAAGWSLRAVTPEEDLVLAPDNGRAVITQDELGNTYDRAGARSATTSRGPIQDRSRAALVRSIGAPQRHAVNRRRCRQAVRTGCGTCSVRSGDGATQQGMEVSG